MNIVLLGYMGCGKSSVGKVLANKMSMTYLDLDTFIETSEGKKISDIFKERGEIYFRKIEAKYLETCLATEQNVVVSLGGGTPCFGNSMERVKSAKDTLSVYLKTSREVLVERLLPEKMDRPLISHLGTKQALDDFIRKHLFERSFYYSQATTTIVTDTKTVEQLADEIISLTRAL